MVSNDRHIRLWALRWETRTKTVSLLLFVFGAVSLTSLVSISLAFVLALFAAMSMGLTMKVIGKSVLLPLPFFFLLSLSLFIGNGWPPAWERIEWVLLIIGKGLTAVIVLVILVKSTTMHQLFSALAHLKVPSVLIVVIFLSATYALHFISELIFIQRAIAARLIRRGKWRQQWKTYGQIGGRLLVSSIDMSERVYQALKARGFAGKLPVSPPEPITRLDVWKSVIALTSITILIVLNRWRWGG